MVTYTTAHTSDLTSDKVWLFPVAIAIVVRAIFCPEREGGGGGGGKLFAQKPLPCRPNFYETVEKKRGSYDATTQAYI